jgi:hypothetical protein
MRTLGRFNERLLLYLGIESEICSSSALSSSLLKVKYRSPRSSQDDKMMRLSKGPRAKDTKDRGKTIWGTRQTEVTKRRYSHCYPVPMPGDGPS